MHTPDPDDPFILLGVPAQPFLADDFLLERYDTLSRQLHPDAGGQADEDFAKLNAAFQTLSDPAKRLKALLAHFGEAPAARTGIIDENLVERFMELGDFIERTDRLVVRYQVLTSDIAKSIMAPSLEEMRRKTAVFLDNLEEELAAESETLATFNPHFDPDGPPPAAPVFAALRTTLQTTAFLGKWRHELRQRQFALESAR
jgi:curved DNA-binding protein CbpA